MRRGTIAVCLAAAIGSSAGKAQDERSGNDTPTPTGASAAGAALGTTWARADLALARTSIRPALFRGGFGEAHMARHLNPYLGRAEGWTSLSARLGPQGLDGVAIRFDATGRPDGIRFSEAKYGSARLGVTRDGLQMGSRWIEARAGRLSAEYQRIAESVRSGRMRIATDGSIGRQRLQFAMPDGKAAVFARDPGGDWEFVGPRDSLSVAGDRAGRIADCLSRASRGRIVAEKYLYRVEMRPGALIVQIKDAATLDVVGRESALPTIREIRVPLSGPRVAGIQRAARLEVAQLLRSKSPTMTVSEADALAADLTRSAAELRRLFGGSSPSLTSQVARASILSGTAASAVGMALDVVAQLYFEGRVNWNGVGRTGLTTFVGATTGTVAGQGTVILLTRSQVVQQFAAHASEVLGVGARGLIARVGGAVGGSVGALASAYFGYAMGWYDLDTAHQISFAGLAGLAAGAATYGGMFALAGAIGTASTGTAIGSLSGAAATSASLAWWGGGSIAAGGGGMATGAIVLTGGAVIVAAGMVYGVIQVFRYSDQVEEMKRLRLTIAELKSRTTFRMSRSINHRATIQMIAPNK